MKKSSFIFFLLLLNNLTFGQEIENRLNGIDQEIEFLIDSYKAVGVSVAVVKNDKVIYSKGFGYSKFRRKITNIS